MWRARKGNSVATGGIIQLDQGRFIEAVSSFKETVKRFPRSALPVYNLGIAQLGLWRVDEAEASFAKANGMRMQMMSLRSLIAPHRAFAAVLSGRTSKAGAHLTECVTRKVDSSAMATLARGVLAAREGRWTDANTLLSRYEVKMLGGPCRGLADALRAWTIQQLTGKLRHVDRIAIFGEREPDALKSLWPELHDFIHRAPAA